MSRKALEALVLLERALLRARQQQRNPLIQGSSTPNASNASNAHDPEDQRSDPDAYS